MKNYNWAFLLPVLLGPITVSSQAEDCVVSTNPPAIIHNFPGVSDDKLSKDSGVYVASLENGDKLMISFSPCELALRGHYLLARDLPDDKLKERVIHFVSQLLPAQGDTDNIATQLARQSLSSGSVVVQGANDEHRITISESSSPFFVKEIHYQWLPPLY